VTVQPAHGLTGDEVEQLVNDSIEHAHADFTTRQLIELRNKAETDLRHTEAALVRAGGQLDAGQREGIAAATTALRTAMAGADLPALRAALDAFGAATNALATLQMNAVLRQALGGTAAADLDAGTV